MTRPRLCFVDATILSALIEPDPSSDRALRWFLHVPNSWITSELSVALCLSRLERRGLNLRHQQACLHALLLLLRHGVGIRDLSLQEPQQQPAHAQTLTPLQALQLHTALHWRCGALISNESQLVTAAQRSGLVAYSLGPPTTAEPGRWETGRRRSPIQP